MFLGDIRPGGFANWLTITASNHQQPPKDTELQGTYRTDDMELLCKESPSLATESFST